MEQDKILYITHFSEKHQVEDLKKLLYAYRHGILKERRR